MRFMTLIFILVLLDFFSNDINKSSTFIVRNVAAKFVHDLFNSNSDKKEERHTKPWNKTALWKYMGLNELHEIKK